jgi:hypothetical protein
MSEDNLIIEDHQEIAFHVYSDGDMSIECDETWLLIKQKRIPDLKAFLAKNYPDQASEPKP